MADKRKSRKPAPAARGRDAAQARAEAERLKAAQAAKERRTKLLAIAGAVLVVVGIVVAVVLVLIEATKSSYGDVAKPPGAIEAGAVVIGQDLAPGGTPAEGDDVVVVRVYSDYMCPNCASVEARLSGKFEELAAAGKIKLEIQPLAILDYMSEGTNYSTRASNAALTVAKYAPDKFLAFHSRLFDSDIQPGEYTEGLTDERLIEVAQEVGIGSEATDKFADQEFYDWITYSTDKGRSDGLQGTPSMWIGPSDSRLTQIEDPYGVNLDDAIARVLAGDNPNG
ncbi:MAG: thioredoxin domain-containing protein [Bifidobacteriaceae bacterium]|jgi:protein-disulfide isomerase|nr:thioredoxin domain-containing protein [Bifidobacteriaceae bacterium]